MKVELGNIVKYHDDKGGVHVGTVSEIHPDGDCYLFSKWGHGGLHGWFNEKNVFFKIKDKCTDHKWDVAHSRYKDECIYAIVCHECCARYPNGYDANPFLAMIETGDTPE